MRILYFHSVPIESESANLIQVKAMCKAFSDLGHEVILSLPESTFDAGLIDQKYVIHERKRRFKNIKFDKYLNTKLIQDTIELFKPDILYVRTPFLLYQTKRFNIPTIFELHNITLHQGSKILNKFWLYFLKNYSKNKNLIKIICISQALANYWVNFGLPPQKILAAHDGIDEEMFLQPLTKKEARLILKENWDGKIITYLGRLYSDRKIENLIHIAKRLNHVKFYIVGGPNSEAEKLKLVCELEGVSNVKITGQVSHEKITDYLYASDILLGLWSSDVPTINYCSPLKLFEYMGSGRLIIAHGFPTILEVLEHEKNALVCDPESTEDLIKKIEIAINMDRSELITQYAQNQVFSKYTWKKRAEEIIQSL